MNSSPIQNNNSQERVKFDKQFKQFGVAMPLFNCIDHGLAKNHEPLYSGSKHEFTNKIAEERKIEAVSQNTKNVFIRCLPLKYKEPEIRNLCKPFEPILCIRMGKKGCAFVRFLTEESAATCIQNLNGKLLPHYSKPLIVKYANMDPFEPRIGTFPGFTQQKRVTATNRVGLLNESNNFCSFTSTPLIGHVLTNTSTIPSPSTIQSTTTATTTTFAPQSNNSFMIGSSNSFQNVGGPVQFLGVSIPRNTFVIHPLLNYNCNVTPTHNNTMDIFGIKNGGYTYVDNNRNEWQKIKV